NFAGIMDLFYIGEKREFFAGYIAGFGRDVGKPERENDPDKYSFVPTDNNQLFRLGYKENQVLRNGTFNVNMYLNPTRYTLDKVKTVSNTLQRADTTALNLGIKAFLYKPLGKTLNYQVGLEWYSRQGVRVETNNRVGGIDDITYPLDNGQRQDIGLFLTVNYTGFPLFDITGGVRHTYFSIEADIEGTGHEKSDNSSSYFMGITRKISKSASIFCNIGRAFRFPSISESFYTGITGRKYVVGNPYLQPESSFNIDTGMKIFSSKFSLGAYLFTYGVDNLIERYKNEEGIYTFDNIERGRIWGGELEARYSPVTAVELFGHYFYYKGKSAIDERTLNDIPAPRIFLGGKVFFGTLWVAMDYLHSFEKSKPGPAEIENASYDLLNLKAGWYFSGSLFIYLKAANLLDKFYYANPDPDIAAARGFSLSGGLHFQF
ncbi:MAG: TonB-dependent receptor, partial [bacterium]|nr:TonB-dependent receptor [bacterium]